MRHVVDGDDAKVILVGEADSRAAAVVVVGEQRADAVILDVQMPVSEGLATIAALRERYPQLGIVVCSFDLDRRTGQQVVAEGADSCLAKPLRRADVHAALSGFHDDPPSDGSPDPSVGAVAAAAFAG